MNRTARGALTLLAVLVVAAAKAAPPAHGIPGRTPPGRTAPVAAPAAGSDPSAVYPLEISVPFHAAFFHWLDSLVGTSYGKTVPLHRRQFLSRFVEPGPADRTVLRAFKRVRVSHAEAWTVRPDAPEEGAIRRGHAALLKTFLETDDLSGAFERLEDQIGRRDAASLKAAFAHFEPRYRKIWRTADHLRRFERDLIDPGAMNRVESLLAEMAAFYGVSATEPPRPRIVLVPVPGGGGTHAQAVGRFLLLEIRPGDTPRTQMSVIAHENAHFLWSRVPEERRDRFEAAAGEHGPAGRRAWQLLHEALPTALGQGVAKSRHWPEAFSRKSAWYHREDVDAFAKNIYPLVRDALREGRALDEGLVDRMVRLAAAEAGEV